MSDNFTKSKISKQDKSFDASLRPHLLDDFLGQEKIQKQLHIIIGAAKKREEPLGHCLLFGPPGLGKTTLAHIIAKSMNASLVTTSGPVLEKPGDLAGVLTNLQKGDVLFIDEIHRLPRCIEEYLYSAMEDWHLDLLIDSGPNARSVKIKIKPFTLIGATTRSGLISSPMRTRFPFNARLDYYPPEILKKIIQRSAKILDIPIEEKAAMQIAQRARGTPRIANNLLRWTRDYAQMHSKNIIEEKISKDALNMLSIDYVGLDEMDKKILSTIIHHHNGGPVGLKTIAVAIGEDHQTLQEVYEPYLIQMGFLKRTPRGREVTKLAKKHIKTMEKQDV